ncbi:MAG TPA: protein kinase [Anaerolineae bacterium]|nr:protein kinase [Anaerolineae bacterium]
MGFEIGESVGPYEIIEQQGQGGMATVFKAYHAALDRYVAIKALNPAHIDDPNFLVRFQREARVVAHLEHPNIVPIYDAAEFDGRPYLVMKFIEGETLKQRLKRGPLSLEEGIHIIKAIGQALIFAHEQGVLHRDIKPSNVLISEDGSIFLADFGLARLMKMGSSTLSSEMLLGTPHYISPEQAQGSSDIDERTDIYSFGAVLYELIVGQVPFDGDTPFSIIHDHIYEPLPLPRSINPNVPEALERVLVKAMAKPRVERYQSVEGLLAAFLAAATGDRVGVMTTPFSLADVQTLEPSVEEAVSEHPVSEQPDEVIPEQESVPEVDAAPGEEKPAPVARKQRNWWWVIVGVVLGCVCLVVFLNALNLIKERRNATPTLSADMNLSPSMQRTLAARTPSISSIGPVQHIQTAEALIGSGQNREAMNELLLAGELFLEDGAYVQAAKTFQRAVDALGGPIPAGFRLRDALTEALYLGAPNPEMDRVIGQMETDYPDWETIHVMRARNLLHQGDMQGAEQLLENILLETPDDPLALAVKAEWLIASEQYASAEEIIKEIMQRPLYPWLTDHLSQMLAEIERNSMHWSRDLVLEGGGGAVF